MVMKNDPDSTERFPVEVAGHLGNGHCIYSAEICSRVNAVLAERGQLITTVGGKPVRVPLAFAEHVDASLNDLLMKSPDVALLVRSVRANTARKVRHGG
jgi:hypothetical protein